MGAIEEMDWPAWILGLLAAGGLTVFVARRVLLAQIESGNELRKDYNHAATKITHLIAEIEHNILRIDDGVDDSDIRRDHGVRTCQALRKYSRESVALIGPTHVELIRQATDAAEDYFANLDREAFNGWRRAAPVLSRRLRPKRAILSKWVFDPGRGI